jgi:8-oxo-dGTP pyrophosphatase MutT (NUDIX family)
MKSPPPAPHAQSGVLAYRRQAQQLEVLLITSRRRSRWIIPKGIVERNLSAAASAEKEAYEEAGITGVVEPIPLGTYTYRKSGYQWTVSVFPFEVTTVLVSWPEMLSRRRNWFNVRHAAELVEEPELQALLAHLPAHLQTTLPDQ